jgi:hypothetical protein
MNRESTGNGTRFQMATYSLTDDQGKFRISVPAPADYYLMAGPSSFTPLAELGYHTVFYSDAKTSDTAQPVQATSSGVTPHVDLQVPFSQTFTVNIKIPRAPEDAEGSLYEISMDRADLGQDQLGPALPHIGATARTGGIAKLQAVLPGSYRVTAAPVSVSTGPHGERHITRVRDSPVTLALQVVDSDVSVTVPASQ